MFLDSSTDDDSIPEERISTPEREYNYPRDHITNSREQIIQPPKRDTSITQSANNQKYLSDRRPPQNLPPPVSIFYGKGELNSLKVIFLAPF